ncbi:unnamed protein product [Amaranthus hypochondriacus]
MEALLKFKSSLVHKEGVPNWNPSIVPCAQGDVSKWDGVICDNGKVWGIQLENMGLKGKIDIDALSQLPELRTLSLKNNIFEGSIPNLRPLIKLRSIFLSNNKFYGEIPDNGFEGMDALRRVVLTNNGLKGKIPNSLGRLPILIELKLDGNQFEGSIPDFQQSNLNINVANNQLEGPIPARLSKRNPKIFSGNKGLCGPPLEPCTSENTPKDASTPNTKPKSSKSTLIVVVTMLALLLITSILIVFVCRNKRKAKLNKRTSLASQDENQTTYVPTSEELTTTTTKKRQDPGKLDFVRNDRKKFDLSELLTASAQVLESGNFESSYKVEIFSGQLLVVKRFRQMTKVGREEFNENVWRMGKLRHPNLLALVAYYYRKEEKLLIFDFVDCGNLASQLHGNHRQKQGKLDWPKRLKIIKGVARGLAYLYKELPSLMVPHGYLKSSNVLLNESYEPLLIDYALHPLINPEHAKQLMVAYKSPEYTYHGRLTNKTDVWNLGILILEILTGKFPTNFLAVGNVKGENLVAWVNDIISEKEKGEDVFDKEMEGTHQSRGEMSKLLKIGLRCSHENVDTRWCIKEALERIEEIKETY